jgi:hypothetical protein
VSKLKAWKFIVNRAEDPDHPGLFHSGKLAVVFAMDEEEARWALERWAAREGADASWLRFATVTSIDLERGAFCAWAVGAD